MAIEVPKALAGFIAFSIQIIAGAVLFGLVFCVAVAIAALIHYFDQFGYVPRWLVMSATVVEVVIWASDLLVFFLFVSAEITKAIRDWWKDVRTAA